MNSITHMKNQIVHFGKSIFDRGLTSGSSGNIGIRLDEGWLITPTNSCLGMLEADEISHLDRDGNLLAGKPPSKELFLHQALLEQRPQDRAVVHLHSSYATAVSCLSNLNPEDALPPLTPYPIMCFGKVAVTPYRRPGDKRLGDDISAIADRYRAVLLANHGPIVAAGSLESAVYAIEELEESAKLFLMLRGTEPRLLSNEQIDELQRFFGGSHQ
ncbi:3-oxo-tetronate 4-phosphate decarboxylase [Marinobacterium aestuariivivens]|uniref:3-oxo-tetronate 4-phosphate decarboxylase n=1 Tax=Marinobacterium aestuariivivens TaxID=1698799 RepID=A0ABW2A125_9GAMM